MAFAAALQIDAADHTSRVSRQSWLECVIEPEADNHQPPPMSFLSMRLSTANRIAAEVTLAEPVVRRTGVGRTSEA